MVRRVEEGWTLAAVAEAAGVSVRTVSKWLRWYRSAGKDGLLDRSSAPRSIPYRISEERVGAIAALRRLRMTGAEIAECLRMPLSTVSAVVTRIGLGKRLRLEPLEPAHRDERKRPGELLHIDVKKLGRIRGATRPYRPRTNGKAERFIRTTLGGWAYGAIYGSSDERRRALPGWLDFSNHRRPHGSLGHQPPSQRLEALTRNNVPGTYT